MPRKGPDLRRSRHNPHTPDIPGPPAQTLTPRGQHSFVKPLASEPNPAPPPVSLDCRGKIGQTVYQLTRGWINHYEHAAEKMLQRRRHVMPFDPQTFLQLLNRCRFAAAVQGWKLLTGLDKREYNRQGNARDNRIEGLNVWIRQFVQDHDIHEFEAEATLRQAQLTVPISIPTFIGITLAAPLLGDTMNVTRDVGPADDQNNIPKTGTYINDINIIATKPGHTLLIGKAIFFTVGAGSILQLLVFKNSAALPDHRTVQTNPAATSYRTLHVATAITDAAIGDSFQLWASDSLGTADIIADEAQLITITA